MELAQFGAMLRAIADPSESFRPFVCDGDPRRCKAFVVGLNPAYDVPFWDFWSDATGLDADGWRIAYRASRLRRGKPEVSATRRRLGLIAEAAAPVAILEANLYATVAPRIPDSRAFELLFAAAQPTAILVHGRDVQLAVERLYGVGLTERFTPRAFRHAGTANAAAVDHLSRVSDDDARMLGRAIREMVEDATAVPNAARQLRP